MFNDPALLTRAASDIKTPTSLVFCAESTKGADLEDRAAWNLSSISNATLCAMPSAIVLSAIKRGLDLMWEPSVSIVFAVTEDASTRVTFNARCSEKKLFVATFQEVCSAKDWSRRIRLSVSAVTKARDKR